MATPTEGSQTTFDSIEVLWTALTTLEETGGTLSIHSYNLEMYGEPTNVWQSVVGGDSNFYTDLFWIENGLITGTDYRFRIRASNEFGWGEYSDEVTIRADEVPAQILPVTTTVQTIYIKIAWDIPSTDNGSPLLEYKILIQAKDSVTYAESAYCNGQDVDLIASTDPSCLVEMTELRAAPYSLSQGYVVKAKV